MGSLVCFLWNVDTRIADRNDAIRLTTASISTFAERWATALFNRVSSPPSGTYTFQLFCEAETFEHSATVNLTIKVDVSDGDITSIATSPSNAYVNLTSETTTIEVKIYYLTFTLA